MLNYVKVVVGIHRKNDSSLSSMWQSAITYFAISLHLAI